MMDLHIDLGQILTILAFVVTAVATVASVKTQVKSLTEVVNQLATRFMKHESTVFVLAGNLQRLIGFVDGQSQPGGRRATDLTPRD